MNFKKNLTFFFSSILIYTIPFIIINTKDYFKFILKKLYILISVSTFFFLINFNLENNIGGGAINFALKKIELESAIFIFSAFGFINIFYIFKKHIKYNMFVLCIFLIQSCLNFHFFQKYIELYWIIYFVFLFKGSNMEYYLNNNRFTTCLISLYSIIFFGILAFK